MNRLNRIVDMLNWKLAEHLYAMRCVKEDEEDKKKREAVDIRNNADQMVYQTEKMLSEDGGREREVDGY